MHGVITLPSNSISARAVAMIDPMAAREPIWTAAYLQPGRERKAQEGIEELGFGTLLPTCVETVKGARGVRHVEHPLLGPYILIVLQPEQFTEWSSINAVEGVARYLVVDGRPLVIPDTQVWRLSLQHAAGHFNFTTVRAGWKGKSFKAGLSGKPSTKPKRGAQEVRQARKAKVARKKLRKLRRGLDHALAESRKW